jgi:hypothetical protein
MTPLRLLLIVLALLVCAPFVSAQKRKKGPQPAKVGERVEYTFQQPLWTAPEYQSLADLRGRPVLVQYWAPDHPESLDVWLPAVVKLKQTYGDAVHVLAPQFHEAQAEQFDALLLRRKLLHTGIVWAYEIPFILGLEGVAACALISPDGQLEIAGKPEEVAAAAQARLAEYVAAAKKAPGSSTGKLATALQDFQKGNYAKAFAATTSLEADPKQADAAKQMAAGFKLELDRWLEQADRAMEVGRVERADPIVARLASGLKGNAQWAPRVDEISRRLQSAPLQKERAALKALAPIERKLYEKVDKAHPQELDALAEQHSGTQAVERIQRLANAARAALALKG